MHVSLLNRHSNSQSCALLIHIYIFINLFHPTVLYSEFAFMRIDITFYLRILVFVYKMKKLILVKRRLSLCKSLKCLFLCTKLVCE